ncbi:MAG: PAS domain-containing protein, partial [Promethearchaeota archaeon]
MPNKSSEMKLNLYDALIETFPDMVVLLDLNGKMLDLSDNVISIYGVERKDECLGKNFFECIAPSDRETAMENFKRAMDKGYLKMVEYNFVTKTGKEFIGELSLSVVKNKDDKLVSLLGIIRDITNQKNIENELRESKKMFQMIMDNIPQYISWKDVNS